MRDKSLGRVRITYALLESLLKLPKDYHIELVANGSYREFEIIISDDKMMLYNNLIDGSEIPYVSLEQKTEPSKIIPERVITKVIK
jgi:hypothetical protein